MDFVTGKPSLAINYIDAQQSVDFATSYTHQKITHFTPRPDTTSPNQLASTRLKYTTTEQSIFISPLLEAQSDTVQRQQEPDAWREFVEGRKSPHVVTEAVDFSTSKSPSKKILNFTTTILSEPFIKDHAQEQANTAAPSTPIGTVNLQLVAFLTGYSHILFTPYWNPTWKLMRWMVEGTNGKDNFIGIAMHIDEKEEHMLEGKGKRKRRREGEERQKRGKEGEGRGNENQNPQEWPTRKKPVFRSTIGPIGSTATPAMNSAIKAAIGSITGSTAAFGIEFNITSEMLDPNIHI